MKEYDLVMIRLPNDPSYEGRQRHYNTWLRGLFVDTDNTFIGEVERIDKYEFTLYEVGQKDRFLIDKIQDTYKKGQQWCYSDNITICECPGLCRNKM